MFIHYLLFTDFALTKKATGPSPIFSEVICYYLYMPWIVSVERQTHRLVGGYGDIMHALAAATILKSLDAICANKLIIQKQLSLWV